MLATRPDVATRYYQLQAYTTQAGDVTTAKQLWGTDPNNAKAPVLGIDVSLADAITAPQNAGQYIEVGGADLTPGNSPYIVTAGTVLRVLAPNAAAIHIVASAAGLNVRGIIS